MNYAKLKFDGKEIELGEGITTIGRTPENNVAFPHDPNVSRFHAEIEARDGEFRFTDVGSSNGSTINGNPARGDVLLQDGDTIILGGSSELVFEFPGEKEQPKKETAAGTPATSSAAASAASPVARDAAVAAGSGIGLLIIAGVVLCLILMLTAGGVAYYITSGGGSGCDAKARIISPDPGETINKPTDIEVDVENGECVERAIFLVDGMEFHSTDKKPFSATIDPKDHPDLADGVDHTVSVMLLDEDGNPVGQEAPIALAFETRVIEKPVDKDPVLAANTDQPTSTSPKARAVTLIEVNDMTKRLVKQFSGNFAYGVSNKQFLQEVQKRTAEYAQDGYFERAARYRDAINVAYVQEQNLDASLGFLLAMSRSKFVPDKQGGEGLWKMSEEFVKVNAYNGLCGAETLSDPSQNCAAKASAIYMKAIVFGVFDGDMIYSAAVFGKSPQDAAAWKASLPQNRADFWNVIKTPQEREQVVRFFAAGIVAENPQKFGLKKDRPLSELYKLTM